MQANSIDDLKESQFPIMAHIINQQGYNHYIIIEKIEEDILYIVDPLKVNISYLVMNLANYGLKSPY